MAIYVVNELLKKYPTAILTMVGPEKDGTQEICKKLLANPVVHEYSISVAK